MKFILLHSLLFSFIIYTHGFIFLKKIIKSKNTQNFYETSLIGLIITIILAQFVNFFLPLNDHLLVLNIILLIFYVIFFHQIFKENLKINLKFFFIIISLSFINIYGSGFSDDLNHYHYSFISNADKTSFIWGQSFLHPLYGTSPSWLIGHSYFNFDQYKLQDIHVLNGIVLFLVLGCLFLELKTQNVKKKIYNPILFCLIFFILLKYTRLKEFGIDRPSTLLFCFLIFYYLKYFLAPNKKDILINFIIIFLISFFIFSIKIIYLPVLLFPLIIFYRHKSDLAKLNLRYLIILLPIVVFIMKNVLGSGCLIYPFETSCVKSIPWSNFIGAHELSLSAEIFNKSWHSYSGEMSKESFIKDFNWIPTWFERGKIEIIELFLTTFSIMIISFMLFNLRSKKFILTNTYLKDFKIILFLIILFSTLIYFLKNPVIRMNHFTIISLMILIISTILKSSVNAYKINFINVLLILGFLFNFSKNYQRIHDNDFINNPYLMVSKKIYKQEKYNIGNFDYYIGWYGQAPISNQNLSNKNYKKKFIFNILLK